MTLEASLSASKIKENTRGNQKPFVSKRGTGRRGQPRAVEIPISADLTANPDSVDPELRARLPYPQR